jgi:hypothetical protein
VPFALAALALAHLFDYVSVMAMVARHGLSAEANPIVVSLALETGLTGLTIAKVAAVSFSAVLLVVIGSRHRRLAMVMLMVGIAVGVVGGLSNVATL